MARDCEGHSATLLNLIGIASANLDFGRFKSCEQYTETDVGKERDREPERDCHREAEG
jgi:hypothetical protein